MPSPEENKTNNSSVLNRVVEGHNHINQQQQQQQLHIHRQDNNIINIESDRESNGEQDEYDVENNQVNNDVVLVAAVEHEDDYRERHAAIGEENERQLSSGEDEEEEEDDNEDFVRVNLSDIRKEVQCPICLGIIRKTRTMMECLHRFCRECIDKSMRLGNNECPACRKHCASRRSLRDDPNFDALIAAIYPDIDQYEEEDMSMQDDEKARNIQIQNSIEQTLRRQTEALTKKGKRVHTTSQRRRNHRSEDEEDSSGDERSAELKLKRSQRSRGLPSPTEGSGIGGVNGNYQAGQKETMVTSPFGVRGSLERLTWGRAGIRSNLRHRGAVGVNANNSHSRILKLAGHLRNLQENESEEIHVTLISLDQQKPYALQDAFIRCKPSLSMRQLCQFIALQTFLPADKVEILAEKGPSSKLSSYAISQGQVSNSCALKPCIDDLQVLDLEETLASVRTKYNFYQGHLILAFRQKVTI